MPRVSTTISPVIVSWTMRRSIVFGSITSTSTSGPRSLTANIGVLVRPRSTGRDKVAPPVNTVIVTGSGAGQTIGQ